MASVALAASDEARHRELDPHLLVDLLWALAEPGLGIEHMRAAAAPGQIEIIFFSTASNVHAATRIGNRLCEIATMSAPQLHGWYVVPTNGSEGGNPK